MRTYENKEFKVTVKENTVEIIKKAFGDRYVCRIEDGKLRAKSSLALTMGIKAKSQFGF